MDLGLRGHRLLATRDNLHGTFHKSHPPVLWVETGDLVSFQTLEVGWRLEPVLPNRELLAVTPRHSQRDDGPALTGPVAVHGARPGMTLEIQMVGFRPGPWGWTSAGGPRPRSLDLGVQAEKASLFWTIDVERAVAYNQLGQEVEIEPFLGTIGLASRDDALVSGWVPHRRTAGNIDATVLQVGSSLFLPVEVEGGLLSVGDGHARQSDGEIAGTAIECPMEAAELRIILHRDMTLKGPRARTRDGHWVIFGFGESLEEAVVQATNGALDVIGERFPELSRPQALAWATTTVDLRITQLVNPLVGAHAVFCPDWDRRRVERYPASLG